MSVGADGDVNTRAISQRKAWVKRLMNNDAGRFSVKLCFIQRCCLMWLVGHLQSGRPLPDWSINYSDTLRAIFLSYQRKSWTFFKGKVLKFIHRLMILTCWLSILHILSTNCDIKRLHSRFQLSFPPPPSPKLPSELRWLGQPNPDTSSTFFIGLFEDTSIDWHNVVSGGAGWSAPGFLRIKVVQDGG